MDNSELIKWINTMPLWFRKATMLYYNNGVVSDSDIKKLSEDCLKENSEFLVENINVLNYEEGYDFYIKTLESIEGVNAINTTKPLEFEEKGITVVYGMNGAGKSGYIRAFKMISGAKYREDIRNNIYSRDKVSPKAKIITGNENDVEKEYICDLRKAGEYKELRNIDIFDTRIANAYVHESKEAEYEPWVFRYLSYMVNVSKRIKDELDIRNKDIVVENIHIPENLKNTNLGIKINNLNDESDVEEFPQKWSEDDNEELQNLKEKNQITVLKERLTNCEKALQNLQSLKEYLEKFNDYFQDENFKKINEAKNEWILSLEAYNTAELLFKNNASTIDSESVNIKSWKNLWKYAKQYYEDVLCSKEIKYTVVGGRCPLCLQIVNTEDVVERMNSVDEYVNGRTHEQEKRCRDKYYNLLIDFPTVKSKSDIELLVNSAGIEEYMNEFVDVNCKFEAYKDSLNKELEKIDVNIINLKKINERLDKVISECKDNISCIKSVMDSEEQVKLQEKIIELESIKWCVSIYGIINQNINKLKDKKKIENAKKSLLTNKITKKTRELAELLITEEYVSRFQSELKILTKNNLEVDLEQQKAGAGRIPYKVILKDVDGNVISPEEILSEGENRVTSLAAFFAESEGRRVKTPLIVDDPVSSLDYLYEERVIQRLVMASTYRQVIVFTHRISMVVGLYDLCKKQGVKYKEISLQSSRKRKGVPAEFSNIGTKAKGSLNKLINNNLSKLKKCEDDFTEEYKVLFHNTCQDFRNVVEKSIEDILLNEVVVRFRKNIITNKRLEKLSEITLEDCKMFDDYMTRYSYYDHSMSDETPLVEFSLDDLEEDMNRLKEWMDNKTKNKMNE